MVPLRSRYPHTGRVTLRYPAPVIHTSFDPAELDAALRDVLAEAGPTTETTTPQVAAKSESETTAGKGGQAR